MRTLLLVALLLLIGFASYFELKVSAADAPAPPKEEKCSKCDGEAKCLRACDTSWYQPTGSVGEWVAEVVAFRDPGHICKKNKTETDKCANDPAKPQRCGTAHWKRWDNKYPLDCSDWTGSGTQSMAGCNP